MHIYILTLHRLAIEQKNSHHIESFGLDLKRVLTAVLKIYPVKKEREKSYSEGLG